MSKDRRVVVEVYFCKPRRTKDHERCRIDALKFSQTRREVGFDEIQIDGILTAFKDAFMAVEFPSVKDIAWLDSKIDHLGDSGGWLGKQNRRFRIRDRREDGPFGISDVGHKSERFAFGYMFNIDGIPGSSDDRQDVESMG